MQQISGEDEEWKEWERLDEKECQIRGEYSGSNKQKQIKAAENSFKGMPLSHYIFYHQISG